MNKNKGFIGIGLILAIVLGIVVIGGGAYYLGKNSSKQEVNNLPIKTVTTNSITEQPFPSVIDTLNTNDRFIVHKGYVVVSGSYGLNQYSENKEIIFTVDKDSISKMPLIKQYLNDKGGREDTLYFTNYEVATTMLKFDCSKTGKATIAISGYKWGGQENDSETTLDKVIDFSPDNKTCK
ncbi:MAG TPA: hypothetical protein VMR49_00010 [Candidatus Paceibacterota bacterium]|jgi:hypothetical protein|nr:hypothetical protein [Candidatus Paceibacterota bacterium]